MNITVFGSAAPAPNTPAYEEARRLGFLLGQAGHTVLTGGYMGTMEAVSRGAAEAGTHVIGVTCAEIESWRPIQANPWVAEQRPTPTLEVRMVALMDGCDAALALPGGIGTLAEITLLWNRMAVQAAPRRPLVLIGQGWRDTFAGLYTAQSAYFAENHRAFLQFASGIEEAVRLIQ